MTEQIKPNKFNWERWVPLWPIIVGFLFAASTYGSIRDQISQHEYRLTRIEQRFDKVDEGIEKILQKLK